MSFPSAANVKSGSLYIVLRNLRPQQSIDFLPQRDRAAGAAVQACPAVHCRGREFSGAELKSDDAKRVIIFECSGSA
jgi:hypothetical protein